MIFWGWIWAGCVYIYICVCIYVCIYIYINYKYKHAFDKRPLLPGLSKMVGAVKNGGSNQPTWGYKTDHTRINTYIGGYIYICVIVCVRVYLCIYILGLSQKETQYFPIENT